MTPQQQTQQSSEDIRNQARDLASRAQKAGVTQEQLRDDISQGYQGNTGQQTTKDSTHTSGR